MSGYSVPEIKSAGFDVFSTLSLDYSLIQTTGSQVEWLGYSDERMRVTASFTIKQSDELVRCFKRVSPAMPRDDALHYLQGVSHAVELCTLTSDELGAALCDKLAAHYKD